MTAILSSDLKMGTPLANSLPATKEEVAAVELGYEPLPVGSDVSAPSTRFTLDVYALILLLGALAGMGPLAIDMYLPSFGAIAADLHSTLPGVQRTLAAYFVGIALGQLVYGPASDRYGRTRPLYIGLVVFAIASVGCALSTSVPMLVGFRFLQALGGCAEMVIARAIVRDRFAPRDAIRVFAGLMLVMGVAPIVAPLLGGWIVTHLVWRAIFWFLVGFALVTLIVVAVLLRETLPIERRQPLSVGGTLRSYAMLLGERPFMAYTLIVSIMLAGLFAYVGGSPLVFIQVFGVSPQHFGWFFGANAVGIIGASQVNGWLAHRGADPHRVLGGALVAATVGGAIMLASAVTGIGGFWGIDIPIFICLASCGFVFANATVLAMAPHGEIAGNASALLGCLQFGVSGLGGFIVSAIGGHSALPMSATIAACTASALAIYVIGERKPALSS